MVAEVYFSQTGIWSRAKAFQTSYLGINIVGDTMGDNKNHGVLEDMSLLGRCDYCTGGQLMEFDVLSTPVHMFSGAPYESYAFVKDRATSKAG